MTRKEIAMEYFSCGYNCSQSVLLAFADLLPMPRDTLAKISAPFGGGMGRLREVCGAVSGMFMVTGLLYGYDTPEASTAKAELYSTVQGLAREFEEINGSIICRELLGLNVKHDTPTPETRTQQYYKKRPCREIVGTAAEILEKYITTHPVKE